MRTSVSRKTLHGYDYTPVTLERNAKQKGIES